MGLGAWGWELDSHPLCCYGVASWNSRVALMTMPCGMLLLSNAIRWRVRRQMELLRYLVPCAILVLCSADPHHTPLASHMPSGPAGTKRGIIHLS